MCMNVYVSVSRFMYVNRYDMYATFLLVKALELLRGELMALHRSNEIAVMVQMALRPDPVPKPAKSLQPGQYQSQGHGKT